MRVLVFAGMIDAKLSSKLAPIEANEAVEVIDLVRRRPYHHGSTKIRGHYPPASLDSSVPLAELWRVGTGLRIAAQKHPSLIVALGLVPHGFYAWLAGRTFGCPVIQHVMGKNDLRMTSGHRGGTSLMLAMLRDADMVAVRGNPTRDFLADNGVAPERIFVPQNLHDFDLFSPSSHPEPTYDLIYVGLLSRYKNLDVLLDAMAQIQKARPGTTLLLVGDGPERRELEEQASRLALDSVVTFLGARPFDELPAHYRNARLFVMTSMGEGLPMAMIEGLSCGLPVVVPQDADICDVAVDGVNALVVQPGDPSACAAAVCRVLDDSNLYERLKTGASSFREERRREYSLAYQTETWDTAMASVLHRN